MKKILILLGILLLVGTASAITWTSATGCWTATDGADSLVMWNETGASIWTVPSGVTNVSYFVLAGGGAGGGSYYGSGGGAGGLLNGTAFAVTPLELVNVYVGDGGVGTTVDTYGNNGSFSLFKTLNATGGGGGGSASYANGKNGGSGAGAKAGGTAGTGIAGQGNNGGAADSTPPYMGGGGGGFGNVGGVGGTSPGIGGIGAWSNITGTFNWYACGGGGSTNASQSNGGCGGIGGNGSYTGAGSDAVGRRGSGGGGTGTIAGQKSGNGSAGFVVIRYTTPTASTNPIPSFTSNVTGGTEPLSVQFNDTSVTSITNWSWNFGEGNTSTIQNATNTFYNGNHYVTLNVINASGSSSTPAAAWINVSDSGGLSGWNRQDIMMDQIYTLTLNIKDATTLSGIPGAVIATSNGDNTTTDLFGVAVLTMNYTSIVVQVGATGYYSRAISYVVDRDRTETIYLTSVAPTTNTSANINIVYIPKQIEIVVVSYDPAGVIVPNAHVDLTAVANTLQADTQLQTLYGINPAAANQLMNGTLVMHGNTDASGGIVFTILQSINYRANVTDPTSGTSYTAMLYPGMDPYTIWIGVNPIKNTTTPTAAYLNNTKLYVTQPDKANITMNLAYQDLSGKTTSLIFTVKYANNYTVAYQISNSSIGTGIVYMNYTLPNIRGQGYWYGYNYTRT